MSALRIALAGFVVSAATLVGLAGPAQAAACQRGTGVTVVVQGQGFNSVRCVSSGGTASSNFGAAGHSLTRVASQPGFVCKVDGRPNIGCQNTPPSDAYWGLYWSRGDGGGWSYSNSGVGSLRVPNGGWVAFVFQDGGRRSPSVTPLGPAPAPKPKPTAAKPTAAKPTATAAKPVTPKPSATASAKPKATPSSTPSAEATAAATASSDEPIKPTGSTTDESSPALLWVAGGLALVLIVAGVVVARARATRS